MNRNITKQTAAQRKNKQVLRPDRKLRRDVEDMLRELAQVLWFSRRISESIRRDQEVEEPLTTAGI